MSKYHNSPRVLHNLHEHRAYEQFSGAFDALLRLICFIMIVMVFVVTYPLFLRVPSWIKEQAFRRLNRESKDERSREEAVLVKEVEGRSVTVPVRYANEEARIGYETTEEALRIAATLPPEGMHLETCAITFTPEQELRGLNAVYAVGTVISTDRSGVLLVPKRTLLVLDKLGIPYQRVTTLGSLNSPVKSQSSNSAPSAHTAHAPAA